MSELIDLLGASLTALSGDDLAYPARLAISHRDGIFTLNDADLPSDIEVVMLGLVKQRIFWRDNKVVCRSHDANTGHADARTFPWSEQEVFHAPADIPPAPKRSFFGTSEPVEKVTVELPCERCAFKSWHRDSLGRQAPAPCQMQFTVPTLVFDPFVERFIASTVSFSKSAMNPAKEYIKLYQVASQPLYSKFTKIRLKKNLGKGEYVYSVPEFRSGIEIPKEMYLGLSLVFREMRGTLLQPPPPRRTLGGFFS